MPNLGGLEVTQIAVLAPGFSSYVCPAQLGAIPATTSFEGWGEDNGVLIAYWHRFKGLEVDAIVTVETPVRDDTRERVNWYLAQSRTKQLLMVIEVEEARVVPMKFIWSIARRPNLYNEVRSVEVILGLAARS